MDWIAEIIEAHNRKLEMIIDRELPIKLLTDLGLDWLKEDK